MDRLTHTGHPNLILVRLARTRGRTDLLGSEGRRHSRISLTVYVARAVWPACTRQA
jgi:hypothetical protein